MRSPAWARELGSIFDDFQAANEKMRRENAAGRLHTRGVGHLPVSPVDAARELIEGQRALRSSRPRNRRWRALEKLDQELDRLTQKQADAQTRFQEAEQALQSAPEHDARTLADWLGAGEKASRPEASVYERERERDAARLLVEGVTIELDKALDRRLQHIEQHRATMVADLRKDMDEARARLLVHARGLPALRQELLDARSTLEWLVAYPDAPQAFGFPSALAVGLREPVQRSLGTSARLEYTAVMEALEEDAAALVDAFSDEQKLRLGMASERSPLKEALWDDDPDNVAWKRRELDRARGLIPWARDQHELAQEASDFRP